MVELCKNYSMMIFRKKTYSLCAVILLLCGIGVYNAKNEMQRFSQTNCSKVGKQNATQKISRTIRLSGETQLVFHPITL